MNRMFNRIGAAICGLFFVYSPAYALSGWSTEYDIAINADASISSDLTDFAHLVHIDNAAGNDNFWSAVDSTNVCRDVRFTASDGTTLLDFETESCDVSGKDGWFHVRIPTTSSSVDTDIKVWSGNASPADSIDGAVGRNVTSVWDSNFAGVWHQNLDHADGAFTDSTSNSNDMTNAGSTDAAGKIDRTRSYDGINDNTNVADNASLNPSNITVSTWLYSTNWTNINYPMHVAKGLNQAYQIFGLVGKFTWRIGLVSSSYKDTTSTTTATNSTDYHVVGTYDGTNSKIYVNGVLETTQATTLSLPDDARPLAFGAGSSSGTTYANWFKGQVEEVKISDTARTLDWVKAEYQSGLQTWITLTEVVIPDTTDPTWLSNGTYTAGAQTITTKTQDTVTVPIQPAGNTCDPGGTTACRADDTAVTSMRIFYVASGTCGTAVDPATDSYQDFTTTPLTSTSSVLTSLIPGTAYCVEAHVMDAAGNYDTNTVEQSVTTLADSSVPVWYSNATYTKGIQSSPVLDNTTATLTIQPAGDTCDQFGGTGGLACRTDNVAITINRIYYEASASCGSAINTGTSPYQDFTTTPLTTTSVVVAALTRNTDYCFMAVMVDAAGNISTSTTEVSGTTTNLEDFSTYTEVDPNSELAISPNTWITANNLVNNADAYIYKDFGENAFNTDITLSFAVKHSGASGSPITTFSRFDNFIRDSKASIDSSDPYAILYYDKGTNKIFLATDEGNVSISVSVLTWYYGELTRDYSTKTWTLKLYSDEARTTQVGTTQTIVKTSVTDYRYYYGISSHNSGSTDYGFLASKDHDLLYYPDTTAPEWHPTATYTSPGAQSATISGQDVNITIQPAGNTCTSPAYTADGGSDPCREDSSTNSYLTRLIAFYAYDDGDATCTNEVDPNTAISQSTTTNVDTATTFTLVGVGAGICVEMHIENKDLLLDTNTKEVYISGTSVYGNLISDLQIDGQADWTPYVFIESTAVETALVYSSGNSRWEYSASTPFVDYDDAGVVTVKPDDLNAGLMKYTLPDTGYYFIRGNISQTGDKDDVGGQLIIRADGEPIGKVRVNSDSQYDSYFSIRFNGATTIELMMHSFEQSSGKQETYQIDAQIYKIDNSSYWKYGSPGIYSAKRVYATNEDIDLTWDAIPSYGGEYAVYKCTDSTGDGCEPTTFLSAVDSSACGVSICTYTDSISTAGKYNYTVISRQDIDLLNSEPTPKYGNSETPFTWKITVSANSVDDSWRNAGDPVRSKFTITAPAGGLSAGDVIKVPLNSKYMSFYSSNADGSDISVMTDAGVAVTFDNRWNKAQRVIGGGIDRTDSMDKSCYYYSGNYKRVYCVLKSMRTSLLNNEYGLWVLIYDLTSNRFLPPVFVSDVNEAAANTYDDHRNYEISIDNSGYIAVFGGGHNNSMKTFVSKSPENPYGGWSERANVIGTYPFLLSFDGSTKQYRAYRDINRTYALESSDDQWSTFTSEGGLINGLDASGNSMTYWITLNAFLNVRSDDKINFFLMTGLQTPYSIFGDIGFYLVQKDIADGINTYRAIDGNTVTFYNTSNNGGALTMDAATSVVTWDRTCSGYTACSNTSFTIEKAGVFTSECVFPEHSTCYRLFYAPTSLDTGSADSLKNPFGFTLYWSDGTPYAFAHIAETGTLPVWGSGNKSFDKDCTINTDPGVTCVSISSIDSSTNRITFSSALSEITDEYITIVGNNSAVTNDISGGLNGTFKVTKISTTIFELQDIDIISQDGTKAFGEYHPIDYSWYRYAWSGTTWDKTKVGNLSDHCLFQNNLYYFTCISIKTNKLLNLESTNKGVNWANKGEIVDMYKYYSFYHPVVQIYEVKSPPPEFNIFIGEYGRRIVIPGFAGAVMHAFNAVGKNLGESDLFIELPANIAAGAEATFYIYFGGNVGAGRTDCDTFMTVCAESRDLALSKYDTTTNVTYKSDSSEGYTYEIPMNTAATFNKTVTAYTSPWVLEFEIRGKAEGWSGTYPTGLFTSTGDYSLTAKTSTGDLSIRRTTAQYDIYDGTLTNKLNPAFNSSTATNVGFGFVNDNTSSIFRIVCPNPGTSNAIGTVAHKNYGEIMLSDGTTGLGIVGEDDAVNKAVGTCGNLTGFEVTTGTNGQGLWVDQVKSYRWLPDHYITIFPIEENHGWEDKAEWNHEVFN